MPGQDHRIGQLSLTLQGADAAVMKTLIGALQSRFDSDLLAVLEDVFDRLSHAGETVMIDTLTLDLGQVEAAPEAISHALGLALEKAAGNIRPTRDRPEARQKSGFAVSDPGGVSVRTLDQLIRFLRRGTLSLPGPGLALDQILADLNDQSEAVLSASFARLLHEISNQNAMERFFAQLPARLVARLILAHVGWPLRLGLAAPKSTMPRTMMAQLAAPLAELARQPDDALLRAALGGALIAAMASPADAKDAADEFWPDVKPELAEDAGTSPIAVFAAGGVLLHPYIAPYLAALGLCDAQGQFLNLSAQARAVLLVHYLITGQTRDAEPNCVLAKLLCGMDLAQPLPRATPIGADVIAEADSLLRAVIRHWPRLGKTSAEGLRAGFLLRPGSLLMAEKGWRLGVERQTIDLLLDDLPWTLSQVKTPFMARLMTVDWR